MDLKIKEAMQNLDLQALFADLQAVKLDEPICEAEYDSKGRMKLYTESRKEFCDIDELPQAAHIPCVKITYNKGIPEKVYFYDETIAEELLDEKRIIDSDPNIKTADYKQAISLSYTLKGKYWERFAETRSDKQKSKELLHVLGNVLNEVFKYEEAGFVTIQEPGFLHSVERLFNKNKITHITEHDLYHNKKTCYSFDPKI